MRPDSAAISRITSNLLILNFWPPVARASFITFFGRFPSIAASFPIFASTLDFPLASPAPSRFINLIKPLGAYRGPEKSNAALLSMSPSITEERTASSKMSPAVPLLSRSTLKSSPTDPPPLTPQSFEPTWFLYLLRDDCKIFIVLGSWPVACLAASGSDIGNIDTWGIPHILIIDLSERYLPFLSPCNRCLYEAERWIASLSWGISPNLLENFNGEELPASAMITPMSPVASSWISLLTEVFLTGSGFAKLGTKPDPA